MRLSRASESSGVQTSVDYVSGRRTYNEEHGHTRVTAGGRVVDASCRACCWRREKGRDNAVQYVGSFCARTSVVSSVLPTLPCCSASGSTKALPASSTLPFPSLPPSPPLHPSLYAPCVHVTPPPLPPLRSRRVAVPREEPARWSSLLLGALKGRCSNSLALPSRLLLLLRAGSSSGAGGESGGESSAEGGEGRRETGVRFPAGNFASSRPNSFFLFNFSSRTLLSSPQQFAMEEPGSSPLSALESLPSTSAAPSPVPTPAPAPPPTTTAPPALALGTPAPPKPLAFPLLPAPFALPVSAPSITSSTTLAAPPATTALSPLKRRISFDRHEEGQDAFLDENSAAHKAAKDASQWNGLLKWARKARGPQWDWGSGM